MAFGRVMLYHKNCRTGKVFDNEADVLSHLNSGWVDFPSKIDEGGNAQESHGSTPTEATLDVPAEPAPKVRNNLSHRKPGRQPKKVKGGK